MNREGFVKVLVIPFEVDGEKKRRGGWRWAAVSEMLIGRIVMVGCSDYSHLLTNQQHLMHVS